MTAFADYFNSVYVESDPNDVPNMVAALNSPLTIDSVEMSEVEVALRSAKNTFVAGVDKIPGFIVRDCASIFCVPLHRIYSLILKTSSFPTVWKTAYVTPVLKKGDPSELRNYRPISLLCNFSKAFESILFQHIYRHVKSYISPLQHGFMQQRSTVTNLSCFTQYVAEILDAGGQVDSIYLDFQKAFDQLDHYVLLAKLDSYGFCSPIVKLMQSYLIGRTQRVVHRGVVSHDYTPSSGIPQGSNLGPLLFLMFIDNIAETITCEALMYADDIKIFSSITSPLDCESLQNDLEVVSAWCLKYRLRLNISKCQTMTFTRRMLPEHFRYIIDGVELECASTVVDLGVKFDSKLTFVAHVEDVCVKGYRMYGFIYRSCGEFSIECLTALFFALVRARLEYAALVWFPIYDVHLKSIDAVQKRFLKFLSLKLDGRYPDRGTDYDLLLRRFDWMSLEARRDVIVMKFLWGLIHNTVDCPSLLFKLNVLVPRLSSRATATFYNRPVRTNVLYRAPVSVMSRCCNTLADRCDVFGDSFSRIACCMRISALAD